MPRFTSLIGRQFGRLTVIAQAASHKGKTQWLCECSCPLQTRTVVSRSNLIRGSIRGCGCLRKVRSEKQIAVSRKNCFAPGVASLGGTKGSPKVLAILKEREITVYDPTRRFARYGAHCLNHRDKGVSNPQCEFCNGVPYKTKEG